MKHLRKSTRTAQKPKRNQPKGSIATLRLELSYTEQQRKQSSDMCRENMVKLTTLTLTQAT